MWKQRGIDPQENSAFSQMNSLQDPFFGKNTLFPGWNYRYHFQHSSWTDSVSVADLVLILTDQRRRKSGKHFIYTPGNSSPRSKQFFFLQISSLLPNLKILIYLSTCHDHLESWPFGEAGYCVVGGQMDVDCGWRDRWILSMDFTMLSVLKDFVRIKPEPKSIRIHFIHGFIPCPALDPNLNVTHNRVSLGPDSEFMTKNKFPSLLRTKLAHTLQLLPSRSLSLINSLFPFTHQLQTSHLAGMLKAGSSLAVPDC